ncbi:fungal-specific transcription factor domain-containing protein [Scheffersomyces xylosifermentans]|uniref:fungal-specific transcription factor domain-containing protein n=1 Tax=Scheffersomyces xylosifermentans TaxID=1304137 RepID=UPI00315DC563
MEKSKVKSILPKPTPSIPPQTPSPSLPANNNSTSAKRRSINSSSLTESKKRKASTNSNINSNNGNHSGSISAIDNSHLDMDSGDKSKQTGHRPVTSCTFCRQHKIKCNASENYPSPCQRCDRMGLKCEIDPQFRPKKGSQIQSLKSDVDELKAKIEMLTKNESLLTQALNQHNLNFMQQSQNHTPRHLSTHSNNSPMNFQFDQSPVYPPATYHISPSTNISAPPQLNDSISNTHNQPSQIGHVLQEGSDTSPSTNDTPTASNMHQKEEIEYREVSEFILGEVRLPLEKANELHNRFITKHLPFLPIITSRSATELYHKSQLLFWTVILTASLSEPEPTLYMSLASLIKQLAIETCWIRTPRSTHVIQALIILSIWPLPNEKVLDDCSYRFIGLAKNLSLQLGLHRGGEFIQEFSRTQVSLGPDAERWRTRSWLAVFFCEQFWSSVLGLPPSINTTDYLLENARVDQSLPKDFRCLISLSIFQCKLVNVMGISVTRPDGLLEPSNRAGSLNILDRELERLKFKLKIDEGSGIDVYYLYIKLMICCFAFLPGTPIEDQVKYVSSAYLSATRVVTITSQMLKNISLIELPIYIRQAMTYSVLLLFKLHLSRYLIDKYVDSSRQSIVTVHRLMRNTLSSWKDLKNDISRTAKVLENLNIVLYTYPDILLNDNLEAGGSIINRMRSHLTASLFYDLVWCVHEARRRTLIDKSKPNNKELEDTKIPKNSTTDTSVSKRPAPLPFYNQITKDDFKTITTTTPNGTTITTLVPTDQAMNQARSVAGDKPIEINGIPLAMLEATGSMKDTIRDQHTPASLNDIDNSAPSHAHIIRTASSSAIAAQLPLVKQEFPQTPVAAQLQSQQLPSQAYSQPPQTFSMMSQNATEAISNQSMYAGGDSMQISQSALGVDPSSAQATPVQYIGQVNGVADQMDNFFQQQSNGWLNNDNYQEDDFLGWFDVNMLPEK